MNAPTTFRVPEEKGACPRCGNWEAVVRPKGFQDCAYCAGCDAFRYNRSRQEAGKPQRKAKTRDQIKPKQRERILERATCRCELCGSRGEESELHIGHLLSLDAGREQGIPENELNADENLCVMCASCNLGLGKNPVPLRLAVAITMARLKLKKGGE